jgi:carboxypeptidase T
MRHLKRGTGSLLIFLLLVLCPPDSSAVSGPQIVSIPKNPDTIARLKDLPLDYLMEKDGRIFIVADSSDIAVLHASGFTLRFEEELAGAGKAGPVTLKGGINGDFHTYAELERDIFALQNRFPHLIKIHDIGDSLEGRNIYALEITNNPDHEVLRPRSLFIGCHHAREWISVEVPYLLAVHLCENYSEDNRIRALVDNSEIWIIPLLNPDGLEYSIYVYRYWRKNRRLNADGSFGVDLNRNYGFQWGISDNGSSGVPASVVYRGESPFSEPESRAVRDLFGQYRFEALISYHNYSQIILFPWGYTAEKPDDFDLMNQLAASMSDLMRSVNGTDYSYEQASEGLYFTNGDTTDWAYGEYGIPAYTIELPPLYETTGGFFNGEDEILPIFRENLPAALYLAEWAVQSWPAHAGRPGENGQRRSKPPRPAHAKIVK